jgi:hypothetical protein
MFAVSLNQCQTLDQDVSGIVVWRVRPPPQTCHALKNEFVRVAQPAAVVDRA